MALPPVPASALQSSAIAGAITVIQYAAVVTERYAWNDDYSFMGSRYPILPFLSSQARPLHGLIMESTFRFSSIDDLAVLRLVGIIGLGVLSTALAAVLIRLGTNRAVAILFAITALSLPPFQIYAAWATTYAYGWTCVLSMVGGWMWERGELRDSHRDRALAFVAFTSAFAVYQPAAVFAFAVLGIQWSIDRPSFRNAWRSVARLLAVVLLSAGVAVAVSRITVDAFGIPMAGRGSFVHTPEQLVSKVVWLATRPLVGGARPFMITSPTDTMALAVGGPVLLLIVCGLLLRFRGSIGERLKLTTLMMLLPFLAFLPYVLVVENQFEFRTLPGLAVLMWWYICLAVANLVRRVEVQVIALAIVYALAARQGMANIYEVIIRPAQTKDAYIRQEVKRFDPSMHTSVVIVNDTTRWVAERRPNLGLLSMRSDLQNSWIPVPNVRLLLAERGLDDGLDVTMTRERSPAVPGVFVLDLTPLHEALKTGG